MAEGKWVKAEHGGIKLGDVVRVTTKDGPQTTIVEGKVTKENDVPNDGPSWCVENFENFYADEFKPDEDGNYATLERFVPAFEWPTKLGAVVTGKDAGETVKAVLVYVPVSSAEEHVWWTAEWGVTSADDISGLQDLTVVSEGVTVEA